MDKNSITGIILITLILALMWWVNKPSEEQIKAMEHQRDSLRAVQEQVMAEAERKAQEIAHSEATTVDLQADSIQRQTDIAQRFGLFADAGDGENQFITLENDNIKITLSSRGGKVFSAELKNYKTFDQEPLILFDGEQNRFGFTFTHNNRVFHTNDLYFTPLNKSRNSIQFVVNAGDEGALTFSYTLPEEGYMLDFSIRSANMGNVISTARGNLELDWSMNMPAQEKGPDFERRYAGVYYKFHESEVDHVNAQSSTTEELVTRLKWLAYKDQFFSTALIAENHFLNGNVKIETPEDKESRTIMDISTQLGIPFDGNSTSNFRFYFGPNNFSELKAYGDLELQKLVYLGWSFLRYINLGTIKVFNFLEGYISNYGIIILILTILIKLLLFPLTYKSYMSTAKMRVLKPQIEEINAKIPKEKAMERQQATMALYRKVGVSPLGGCLPMLLQMPILFAMFQFFPASIELRQESFLWATDLSSYDAIVEWSRHIPLVSTYYGNHISLFTVLMSITNIVYTRINQEMTQTSQQMPGMKTMMYMMPVMFMVFFNNYASGLSYYYFISTLITIGQTVLIRSFVDEDAILAKLKANQKKPKQKSGFQKRLEDMQKQKQLQAKKKR